MRALLVALLGFVVVAAIAPGARAQDGAVLLVHVDGEITRATVQYVAAAIATAEADNAPAVILRFDTPGGGLAETQELQDMFLRTRIPIFGWVGPAGSNAWSAGTILLESTDFAAMAGYTVIGSAHPVELTAGGFQPVTDPKIINALVASLTEQLTLHDRNVSLATAFIVDNVNLNAQQALAAGAIEAEAVSASEVLAKAASFRLPANLTNVAPGGKAQWDASLASAPIVEFNEPLGVALYGLISNPVVSGLLLLLGIYAIIFGISAPGHGAEIAGVIMVLLGILGLGFAVNLVGVALLLLGIAFLIIEAKVPGFGVWGVAGLVCIVLGTVFIAPIGPMRFLISQDAQLVILAALLTPTVAFGLFLLWGMYKVMEIRRRRPVTGRLVGEEAEAIDPIPPNGRGYVRFRGELWTATAAEAIEKGERVVIAAKEGVVLVVLKKTAAVPAETSPVAQGPQAT